MQDHREDVEAQERALGICPAHGRHRRRHPHADSQFDSDSGSEDRLQLVFEAIPFFGQGDSDRDNIVRTILHAADPQDIAEKRDEYGNSLLILACQYRCDGLVPIILARSDGMIDVNATNAAGVRALHFACHKDSICIESAALLLKHGATTEAAESTYG